jgi:hypothetical protein
MEARWHVEFTRGSGPAVAAAQRSREAAVAACPSKAGSRAPRLAGPAAMCVTPQVLGLHFGTCIA